MGVKIVEGEETIGRLGVLKASTGEALVEMGMPAKVFILIATTAPTAEWMKEHGICGYVEATPNIGVKAGGIFYSHLGKVVVNGRELRMQGNNFLPNKYKVDSETHALFIAGKRDQEVRRAMQKSGNKGKTFEEVEAELYPPVLTEEEELEAGEQVA